MISRGKSVQQYIRSPPLSALQVFSAAVCDRMVCIFLSTHVTWRFTDVNQPDVMLEEYNSPLNNNVRLPESRNTKFKNLNMKIADTQIAHRVCPPILPRSCAAMISHILRFCWA